MLTRVDIVGLREEKYHIFELWKLQTSKVYSLDYSEEQFGGQKKLEYNSTEKSSVYFYISFYDVSMIFP